MTFEYTPDDDTQIHEQGAIRLLCRGIQSHEHGLPEWVKNASDEYARRDAPPEERLIIIILQQGGASTDSSISVLDFNGMTSEVIEDRFRVWADPEASKGGRGTGPRQGGHGNGGKCYMTMMFESHALLHTVRAGLGNRYGVRGGSVQFGYIPDPERGRNYPVADLATELAVALAKLGVDLRGLPPGTTDVLRARDGFTLVTGRKPKGLGVRLPASHLVDQLADHPQMAVTLEYAKVFVVSNGALVARANPLVLAPLAPDPAFASDRIVSIPRELVDPAFDQPVGTAREGVDQGCLTLKTSDVSMRYKRRARHNIVYRARSGVIGFRPVLEFDIQSPFRDRIYGECELAALEDLKQNQRAELADSPLTRALEAFVAVQIQEYAREFEARDRRKYDQKERDELSKINDALDRWKNGFMMRYLESLWGPGGKEPPPPPPPPLPSGTPKSVVIGLSHAFSGVGVSFRPTIKFLDKHARRIRPVPYRWLSTDTNVALPDESLHIVTTFTPGRTEIWAETLDGRLASNRLPLDVVRIREVALEPSDLQVPLASRRAITATCELSNGERLSDVYLLWMEGDPTVARVSAAGQVFGHGLGKTEVLAGDDRCMAERAVAVEVVSAEGSGDGGDRRGKGFPRILLSGVQEDPETGETVNFSSDDPPVWQRPQDADRNIWWINSSAPLAKLYLDPEQNFGYRSREWRIYHVERIADIMVQIALSNEPSSEGLDVDGWILKWGERMADIQKAMAESLADFIATGVLPELAHA